MRNNNLTDKEIKEWIRSRWDNNPELYDSAPGFGTAREMEAWKSFFSSEFGGEKLRILDVGTGTGFLSLMLAELGHDVVGIDLTAGMLAVAKKSAKERELNLDLKIGDAESLDFEDESFDAVVSRWVLWTLPNPESAICEWSRVAKTGGKVYAFTSDMSGKEEGVGGWIKVNLAMLMITVVEKRNAWARPSYYDKGVEEKLPLGYNKHSNSRMNSIVKLFEQCGLADVSTAEMDEVSRISSDQVQKKTPLRYKLAWNLSDWWNWYCVSGRKPLTGGTEKEDVQ